MHTGIKTKKKNTVGKKTKTPREKKELSAPFPSLAASGRK
jgi:hypothetical protein